MRVMKEAPFKGYEIKDAGECKIFRARRLNSACPRRINFPPARPQFCAAESKLNFG
jgi:hypothetical protein